MSRHALWKPAIAIAALVGLALPPAAAAAGRRPAEGTEITIAGIVSDADGSPVEGVTVEITASRRAFSLRDFRVRTRGSRSSRAVTDAGGNFEMRWTWHPYFNRFELAAGVEVGVPGGETALRVLQRRDLTRRMRQASPVVATFELADRSFVDSMRQLLKEIDSEDERRVYREMGKPDKVRHTKRSGRPETSWWYFAAGRVYWFGSGELEGVDEFEPILEHSD